jgi:hypothetical protein
MATPDDFADVMRLIERANGSAFVSAPIRSGTRQYMYALLNVYGVTDENTQRLVSDKDLVVLYSTARGGRAAGQRVASNIAAKYGSNPLLDPMTLKPGTQPPAPPPAPPSAPSDDMSKYATKTDMATLRSDLNLDFRGRVGDVRSDMEAKVREVQDNLTNTLLAVTDALPDAVKGHVDAAIKALTPTTLTVVIPNQEPTPLGLVHRKTAALIKMLAAGENVYLHGPAGSGKTTAGRKCADAFGLPFYFAAKVESEYMLLGFKDARGETVRTQFREAYEHGGVFLFDELDGSSPAAVVALNAALANGICPFPDGIIMRHANFKCIGAGNTKLSGASRQYVGRSQLDAASIDRFAFLEWGYDDALETKLARNPQWCEYVQAARKSVADRGLPHLITPRATYAGCNLLEAGLDWHEVADAVIWKGLDGETVTQIVNAMPRNVRELASAYVAPAAPVQGIL